MPAVGDGLRGGQLAVGGRHLVRVPVRDQLVPPTGRFELDMEARLPLDDPAGLMA